MGFDKLWRVLLAAPIALGGCGALTPGTATPTVSAAPRPTGSGWIVIARGSAAPTAAAPSVAITAVPTPTPLPWPTGTGCAQQWDVSELFIPITVTPGKGSFTVAWPRQWNSNYRLTAVPQRLVRGTQPAPVWQAIAPASTCTVTATIRGLTSGAPYVIWLDAPNSGYAVNGSRHPYSGRSGVVYPQ